MVFGYENDIRTYSNCGLGVAIRLSFWNATEPQQQQDLPQYLLRANALAKRQHIVGCMFGWERTERTQETWCSETFSSIRLFPSYHFEICQKNIFSVISGGDMFWMHLEPVMLIWLSCFEPCKASHNPQTCNPFAPSISNDVGSSM